MSPLRMGRSISFDVVVAIDLFIQQQFRGDDGIHEFLVQGVNDGGVEAGGGGDISAGEESLFKKEDPVLLRNATLETECASAKVQKETREKRRNGSERRKPRGKGWLLPYSPSSSFFVFVVPPLSQTFSLSLFPSLKTKNHRKCPRPQSPGTGSRDSTAPPSCDGKGEKVSRPPPR